MGNPETTGDLTQVPQSAVTLVEGQFDDKIIGYEVF